MQYKISECGQKQQLTGYKKKPFCRYIKQWIDRSNGMGDDMQLSQFTNVLHSGMVGFNIMMTYFKRIERLRPQLWYLLNVCQLFVKCVIYAPFLNTHTHTHTMFNQFQHVENHNYTIFQPVSLFIVSLFIIVGSIAIYVIILFYNH